MTCQEWRVEVTAEAARTLGKVPPRVVGALVEFIYGGLAENPERRGKPLRGDLEGYRSARRGDYRVIYRLDPEDCVLYVLRVAGRAAAYRRR